MKIVIVGAQGFIASHLAAFFKQHECICLSRHPKEGQYFWDPENLQIDPYLIADADLVINVAGENILGRWTTHKKEKILQSRVRATKFLVEQLSKHPPEVYIGASAIGFYGYNRQEGQLTENSQSGHGYLAEICRLWEKEHAKLPSSRVIQARFGIVVGKDGGALAKMASFFRKGLGGKLGSGKQWMSWISIDDVCNLCRFCFENKQLAGPINFTTESAVTNKQWTEQLSSHLHRPAIFSAPEFIMRAFMGEPASMLLGSLKVYPERLLKAGYHFSYPTFDSALKAYL